ncbi:hypothetical protein CUT44_02980 [Streptomyces carminius]|uniref:RHS repeat-associated core domain-containing protein n=1 Tax=Streptomyces carminius TaxID=2665496 RepID=A0A2M8M5N3_9ACTN|nr:hypothetical protein [Streptomyces carminius]PJE99504.1 hypothetical protein CUT44_02980 [Streptomyces carminius]
MNETEGAAEVFSAPHLGRFTQPDLSGKETSSYLYATGDPVNHTDPTGLSCSAAVIGAMAGVGGFLIGTAGMLTTPMTGGASSAVAFWGYQVAAVGLGPSIGGLFSEC